MARRAVLPEAVLVAQRKYIDVKRRYGICTQLTCSRNAESRIDRCTIHREQNKVRSKNWNDKRRDTLVAAGVVRLTGRTCDEIGPCSDTTCPVCWIAVGRNHPEGRTV